MIGFVITIFLGFSILNILLISELMKAVVLLRSFAFCLSYFSFPRLLASVYYVAREDRIPTEVMLLLTAAAVAAITAAIKILIDLIGIKEIINSGMMPGIAGAAALIISLVFSFFYYSYVRRIKAGTVWKNSLLKRLCVGAVKGGLYLYDHGSVLLRVLVPYGSLILLNLLVLVYCVSNSPDTDVITVMIILLLIIDAAIGIFLYRSALDRQHILDGIKRINAGDTEHKINENGLHGDNLVLAREVNGIGEGIRNAVATSMKDERLKADLITNVSHDIKTPLTSIQRGI